MTIYEKIRYLRNLRGVTLEEISKKIGYKNASAVSKLERGEIKVTVDMLPKLSEALGVTPEWLVSTEAILDFPTPQGITRAVSIYEEYTATDDSMLFCGIREGSVVSVLPIRSDNLQGMRETMQNGDIVLVEVGEEGKEERYLFKWFSVEGANVMLVSQGKTLLLTQKAISEREIRVIGTAVSIYTVL